MKKRNRSFFVCFCLFFCLKDSISLEIVVFFNTGQRDLALASDVLCTGACLRGAFAPSLLMLYLIYTV